VFDALPFPNEACASDWAVLRLAPPTPIPVAAAKLAMMRQSKQEAVNDLTIIDESPTI
jgi:hypothetical protein